MMARSQARRSNAAFTVVVALVMLLCAVGMGFILLLSGAPAALVVGVVLAALPVTPLIAAYLWLDRYEPEPRSLLVLGLGWGAFVATAVALLLQVFDTVIFKNTDAFNAVVVAPLTEEGAKGLFIVLLLIYRRQELDGILDGIVYAGMIGIGFAFTENILYLTSAYMGSDHSAGGLGSAVGLFIVRCLFGPVRAPVLHRLHRHRRRDRGRQQEPCRPGARADLRVRRRGARALARGTTR